jgi:hypothetical protein
MNVYKETIWHFTCKACTGFWSVAASDEWVPTELFCPHCSSKRTCTVVEDVDNNYHPTQPIAPDPDIDYIPERNDNQQENYFEKDELCSCGHKVIECDCKAGCECGCRKQFLGAY